MPWKDLPRWQVAPFSAVTRPSLAPGKDLVGRGKTFPVPRKDIAGPRQDLPRRLVALFSAGQRGSLVPAIEVFIREVVFPVEQTE